MSAAPPRATRAQPSIRRRRVTWTKGPAVAAVAALLVGCASHPKSPDSPARIVHFYPEPSTGPFVVVVVDNHFHDIHPVDRTRISVDRPFVVKNQGRNLHNFTVVGTSISIDIDPGHSFTWVRLGDHLAPGSYQVVCNYHAWAGMTGSFVVTG
jgi:hypothetical protein